MAVGVKFYGRGTRRPGENIYEPGGGYPDLSSNQPGAVTPRTTAQIAAQQRAENAARAAAEGRIGQVPGSSNEAQTPAEIAAAIAEGLVFEFPNLFPQAAPASSSGSSTLAATLAELEYKREQDKAEQKRNAFGAAQSSQMLQDMLANLPTRFTGLSNIIGETGKQNEEFIKQQYAEALRDLTSRRDTGAALQKTGFETAARQLGAMQPTAFQAPALALPAAATNQLQQYLSARGVPQQEIEAEVVKVNQASQDAQTNYTGLLGTLSAIEQNAQQSRVVENSLAQAVANAQLQTIYGGASSGLEQQRLKSLNDLFNQLQAQRFQLEQTKIAREDALNDALAKLAQSGYPIRGAADATQPPSDNQGSGSDGGGTTGGGFTPSGALQPIATTDPGIIAAAEAQGISPQLLVDLATNSGNPLFGAPADNRVFMMKDGGVVTKPTLAVIGEDGPEAVVPLTKPGKAKKVTKQAQREMVKQKFMRKYGMA